MSFWKAWRGSLSVLAGLLIGLILATVSPVSTTDAQEPSDAWQHGNLIEEDAWLLDPNLNELREKVETLTGKVEALQARINGIKLQVTAADLGNEYACGQNDQGPGDFYFMVGLRDGTSCNVTNVHWYRELSLVVPN